MKTPSSPSPAPRSDLKALAIIGAVFVVLMFAAPILLGYIVFLRSTSPSGTETNDVVLREDEPLGEQGSRCGGNARLPCRPGLVCSKSAPEVGLCIHAEDVPAVYPQLNAACDITESPSCAPGLVCEYEGGTAGVCKPSAETSPKVISTRLEGFQPAQGGYVAAVGSEATAEIQTVNAKSVTVFLVSGETKEALTPTESEGGIWTVQVKMPSHSADLVVTAIAQNTDRSSLVVRIAPTE